MQKVLNRIDEIDAMYKDTTPHWSDDEIIELVHIAEKYGKYDIYWTLSYTKEAFLEACKQYEV